MLHTTVSTSTCLHLENSSGNSSTLTDNDNMQYTTKTVLHNAHITSARNDQVYPFFILLIYSTFIGPTTVQTIIGPTNQITVRLQNNPQNLHLFQEILSTIGKYSSVPWTNSYNLSLSLYIQGNGKTTDMYLKPA